MTVGLSTTARNNVLNAIRDLIDADAAAGYLEIYSGVRPATGAAPAGVLLATLTFSVTSAPAAAAGVLTFNAITSDSSADATGTATFARIKDGAGVFVIDVDVGTAGPAEFVLNTVSIVAGAVVSCSAGTITAPNA